MILRVFDWLQPFAIAFAAGLLIGVVCWGIARWRGRDF
jgi:hypothetical protein